MEATKLSKIEIERTIRQSCEFGDFFQVINGFLVGTDTGGQEGFYCVPNDKVEAAGDNQEALKKLDWKEKPLAEVVETVSSG